MSSALNSDFDAFQTKLMRLIEDFELERSQVRRLSLSSARWAARGDWTYAGREFAQLLRRATRGKLDSSHTWLSRPFTKEFSFPSGVSLRCLILNRQGQEWYASDSSMSSFDFVKEDSIGIFSECQTFLDLGGHQGLWSTYYGLTRPTAVVDCWEPSLVNGLISLFNFFRNGVIQRVNLVPMAVTGSGALGGTVTPLVDFVSHDIGLANLSRYSNESFDFVKIDIEGGEFSLLPDLDFRGLVKRSKYIHLEIHPGHFPDAISREFIIENVKAISKSGIELGTGVPAIQFLETCDLRGFHSLLLSTDLNFPHDFAADGPFG